MVNAKQKRRADKKAGKFNYAVVGALLWVSTIQFYIVQLIVANAWVQPFSYTQNYISDLGNTLCTSFACSPLYVTMNVSFIALGLSILIGALLFASVYRQNNGAVIGFLCLALSGLGTMFVGIFPADVNGDAHGTGAFTSFLLGNLALIILGVTLREFSRWVRYSAVILGLIGLISLPFFMEKMYFGLGVGVIERFVAYPQSIWMIIFGITILMNIFQKTKSLSSVK